MKIAERIIMVALLLAFAVGVVWLYFAVQYEEQELRDAVARGEFERPIVAVEDQTPPEDWRVLYPDTIQITIKDVPVHASIADTLSKRIKGLSDTPYLPADVVKLFAFGVAGEHSIWMKDMNYSLDILWVDQDGTILHIEEQVSPDSFPESFSSPKPAWYVIEASAGFVASNTIAVGDEVTLPIKEGS